MRQGQMGVVAHFAIRAGRHDDFEEAARDATGFVQTNEPDGLIYDWHVADDGTSAAVYEVWASPEAVLAHLHWGCRCALARERRSCGGDIVLDDTGRPTAPGRRSGTRAGAQCRDVRVGQWATSRARVLPAVDDWILSYVWLRGRS